MNWNNFRLQVMLNGLGYDTRGIDGVIGRNTTNAITNFQNDYGLHANGQADQNTVNTLHAEFMEGDIEVNGYVLQAMLLNAGFSPGKIDGIAGRNTENALIKFQRHYGLYVGDVDEDTVAALKSALYPNDAY